MKVLKIVKYVAIGVVVAFGGLIVLTMIKNQDSNTVSTDNRVTIQKMDLDNSVSITGKGVSDQIDYVFADLSAPVKEINVHKGDYIRAGDLICTFDVKEITEQRDSYAKLLEDFEKYNKMKTDNYNKGNDYEKDLIKMQIVQLEANINATRTKYNEAVDNEQNYTNWCNDAAAEADGLKAEYEAVDAEIESIRSEIALYNEMYPQTEEDTESEEESEPIPPPPYDMDHYTDLVKHSAKLKNLYDLALGKKRLYEAGQMEAHSDVVALDATIKGYNAELAQYKAQESSSGTMSIEIRNDLLADSKTQTNYIQKIEELNKKIENSKVTSKINGIITDIYASVGDYMMDQPICQIQDEGKMHFEAYLNPNKSEFVTTDSKILVSMAVNNFEPLEGSILSISDYYDTEKNGYKVEFTFDGIDNMEIYPGFEAAAKIIISQQKDTMVVPYDAIFEKDGKTYVRKVNTIDDSTEDIEVKKGLETSYYVAISSSRLNVNDVIMSGMQDE